LGPEREGRVRRQHLENVLEIRDVVGRDAQLGAGCEDAREGVEERGLDQAALVMARLGPGVGKQDEGARHRPVGEPRHHGARVLRPDAHVVEAERRDARAQRRKAVDERLAADEADVAMRRGLGGEVLAAAEADLQPKRLHGGGSPGRKARAPVERARVRQMQREVLQPGIERARARRGKLAAAAAAVGAQKVGRVLAHEERAVSSGKQQLSKRAQAGALRQTPRADP
jgi:hypothetical protein